MIDRDGRVVQRSSVAGLVREAQTFLPMALPMAGSRLGLALMGVVNGVLLAALGEPALALWGLAEGVAARLLEVGLAASLSGLALAAQAAKGSAAERLNIGHVWRHAVLVAAAAGGLGLVLTVLLSPLLEAWVGAAPAAGSAGSGRLLMILGLGLVPGLIAAACGGVLELLDRHARVGRAMLAANGLNLALAITLVKGLIPGLPQGAEGVAWALVVGRTVLALLLVLEVRSLPDAAAIGLKRRFGGSAWRAGGLQRRMALRSAVPALAMALVGACPLLMAAAGGQHLLAAWTGLVVVLTPLMAVGWGLSDAGAQRVAQAVATSAQKPGAIARSGRRCAALLVALMALAGMVYLAAPGLLIEALLSTDQLLKPAAPLLLMGVVVVVLESLALLYASSLRALGQVQSPWLVQLVVGVVVLPLGGVLVVVLEAGLPGLLAMQGASAALRALALAPLFRSAAGLQDDAALQAMRSRAAAVARGWADTILLWPSRGQGGAGGAKRSRPGRA